MQKHPHVRQPKEILAARRQTKKQQHTFTYYNDIVLEWITDNILASIVLFDIALVVPLLVIPAPDSLKITLGVISGSWIQWWALPALQRSQNKTQAQNDAKAEVDHETLTYLATLQDEQMKMLTGIDKILGELRKRS